VQDKECISRKKFIRLGAAIGLSSAAVPLVSACGGSGNSAESGGPPKASDVVKGGPKVGKGQTIAKQSEVKPGSAFPFTTDTGQQSVLVHLEEDKFVAYSAVCTHQGCTVAYKDDQLACPCHGSVFDPTAGAAVLNGPANRPLPEVAIRVEGGEVIRA
jgi:Rieske Fe-S protein